ARYLRVALDEADALRGAEVTETVPSLHPMLESCSLRPFAHVPGRDDLLRTTPLDDAIELTGSAAQVRFATRMLDLIGGGAPALSFTFATTDRATAWPGGEMSGAEFVRYFADALDANVIGEIPDTVVALGAPTELTQRAFYARASKALYDAGVWIAPRLPEQRLFVACSTTSERRQALARCADFEPSDRVAERTDALPVTSVVELQQLQAVAALQKLMPRIVKGRMTCAAIVDDRKVLLCGPCVQVAEFVDVLLQADSF
ncbi:MAG: hypothetical protein KAI24_09110, partial [Planctomycetes bacterium]|nr:hypothetical protein [Planctomycetota bacterium]